MIVSEDRERKPTSKCPLTGNVNKKRSYKRNPSSLFQVSWMEFFMKKSWFVAVFITFKSFPDFLNLSKSCQEKVVFVQRHNAALHWRLRQTALKWTDRKVSITLKLAPYQICVSLIFDSEKF